MKKQTLVIILLAVFALSCLALVGCSHTHEFGEWMVVKQATCTEDGLQERYCSCGEKQSTTVVATGHTVSNWEVIKYATCFEDGKAIGICTCGEHVQKILPQGHKYNVDVVQPTCTEQGYTMYECAYCFDFYVDSYVDALGHDEVEHDAKEATCVEVGWEKFVTCSRCEYSTYQEIPATGHSFDGWRSCTKCGELTASSGFEMLNYGSYYVVYSIGTCLDVDIIIPSVYNDKPVAGIASGAFENIEYIRSVNIPSSITSIGDGAFKGCSNLTKVVFEDLNGWEWSRGSHIFKADLTDPEFNASNLIEGWLCNYELYKYAEN